MPQYSPAESALWWSAFDAAFALLARREMPVTTVRYEDFVADPRDAVARTLAFAELQFPDRDLDHITPGRITLRSGHLVAGNPMRFRTGNIVMSADEAWRSEMSDRDRWLVTTDCWTPSPARVPLT